jgi:hypothetical protein
MAATRALKQNKRVQHLETSMKHPTPTPRT